MTATFAAAVGLAIRPMSFPRAFKGVDGEPIRAIGRTDIPMHMQLMIGQSNGDKIHWDRRFMLRDVYVVPFGPSCPRDLFIRWEDWDPTNVTEGDFSPLSELADLVCRQKVRV